MPVTSEAPATSNAIDFTEPHSVVMPSSEEYRKTGALPSKDDRARTEAPAKETDQQDESGNQDDSASSEDAAASEAARSAEEQAQPDRQRTTEKRWQKRERELKEARAEIARLKAQGSQPRSDTSQASQPAAQPAAQQPAAAQANAEPQIDEIDPATKKPKFATFNDYLKAHAKWNREEAIREIRADGARTAQETERAEIGRSLSEHVEKAKKSFPDYAAVTNAVMELKEADGRSPIFYTPGSHIDNFLLSQPDRGVGLIYHCCKNASDPAIRAIFARTPDGTRYQLTNLEQISRLAVLAHTLKGKPGRPSLLQLDRAARRATAAAAGQSGEDEGDQGDQEQDGEGDEGGDDRSNQDQGGERSSAKPISQAPRPAHQTSGKGSVAKDPVVEAVETGDSETYIRELNRVALARRKKGKT